MATSWGTDTWAAYVRLLRRSVEMSQVEFAAAALGDPRHQGKISRWEGGKGAPPDRAADVADFARRIGRNPLEAFVAAGMLNPREAGRGLDETDRYVLREVAREGLGQRRAAQLVRELEYVRLAHGGVSSDQTIAMPPEQLDQEPSRQRPGAGRV